MLAISVQGSFMLSLMPLCCAAQHLLPGGQDVGSIQQAHCGSLPDQEVDRGGAGVKEHDAISDKGEGVPEVIEGAALLQLSADVELRSGRSI